MKRLFCFATIGLAALFAFDSCDDGTKVSAPETHSITLTDDGNGTAAATVGGAPAAEAEVNAEITLTATPAEGHIFDKWTVVSGGVELSDVAANPATFAMPAENVEIKAEFVPTAYAITLTDDGNGTAAATVGGAPAAEARANAEVTLRATPAEKYVFDKWTVVSGGVELSDVTANPATFAMPAENVEIRAEFVPAYAITLTGDGNGTAAATVGGAPAAKARANAEVTLRATPAEKYVFDKWTVVSGGAELSDAEANPATFAMPAENVEIKAGFRFAHEPEMIFVEGGTFLMGSDAANSFYNERPAHEVTLSSYYIGKYEVTQAQWVAVMVHNPSTFKGDDLPVEYVSWDEAQIFVERLNRATGKRYALPTEAQWEFAARGGNQSMGYKYSGSDNIDDVAWHADNSNHTTHAVGSKLPNELGIYDMTGNVLEWCSDRYGAYPAEAQTDPTGPSTGSDRVDRGGSWFNFPPYCGSLYRYYHYPTGRSFSLGFRVAHAL